MTHSVIADQWDYEIRISEEERSVETLKKYVRIIWKIVTDAEDYILREYPDILLPGHPTSDIRLPKEITFLTSEELHAKYPKMDVHERETAAVREYGAIFIIGMGWPMKDGSAPEEVRAPAYDDWNMNGDIMVLVSNSFVEIVRIRWIQILIMFLPRPCFLNQNKLSIRSLATATRYPAWASE